MQRQRIIWILNLIGLALFSSMLYMVFFSNLMQDVDRYIGRYTATLHTEIGTKIVLFVTTLNGVAASTILLIAVACYFWYKKWYRNLRFFLFSGVGGALLFNLFKFTLQRARPDARLFDIATYSFPSGHTTMATVMTLSLYFIVRQKIGEGVPQRYLTAITLLWPLTIAFTRVYLNVHWFSDVLAALGLGLFWVTLVVLIYPPEKG